MFGQNQIRKIDHTPEDGKIAVQEVFYTIQGEGPFSGQPAVFVRLAGCHLACTFCDTEFESGINNRLTTAEVISQVRASVPTTTPMPKLVVITGGEPLRQNIGELVSELLHGEVQFKDVQLETAGNLWDPSLDTLQHMHRLTIVCSPKTPHVNAKIARYCRHFKYVVRAADASAVDGLPDTGTQAQTQDKYTPLWRPWHVDQFWTPEDSTIWVSPMDEHDKIDNEVNLKHAAALALRFGYRLSLQVHKIVNLP